MKAEEYYKEVEDIGRRTIQEDGTYVSLEYCFQLMTDFAEKDKEKISCLVGYLKMWLNGQRIPDELPKVIEEAEEYLFFEVITNHKNQKEDDTSRG